MKTTALIIDDEIQIRRLLRVALEAADYAVHETETGQQGLQEAALRRPNVILLDLGLPDLDGLTILQRLREWSETPGADDYVTKPFSTVELLARLRAAQRRAHSREETSVFRHGELGVDVVAHLAKRAGQELKLSATEWALLALLIRHAGRVLTHRQILREVWGPKSEEHRQYLRVYFTHLRKKIERDPAHPELIRTEPGIGYRLTAGE